MSGTSATDREPSSIPCGRTVGNDGAGPRSVGSTRMTSSPEPASAASLPFDAIVEQAPVALIFADREGVIRVWNRAAEAMFGRSAQESVGESLDLIIPERFR